MKYFDLQVNGYGSVDFNRDAITAGELRVLVRNWYGMASKEFWRPSSRRSWM